MSKVLNVFKIAEAGKKRDSPDLLGLEIEQTEEGYQLVAPRRVLATTTLVNMDPTPGKPIMTFHVPRYVGWDWHISVTHIDSTKKMHGEWSNNDKNPAAEEDIWVATGSGAGEEEPGDQGAGGKGKGDDEARAAYASQ